MRIKYHCTHCDHTFELEEREFQRCPNCFWTTSLVPASQERSTTMPSSQPQKPVAFQKPSKPIVIAWKPIFFTAGILVLGASAFIFFKRGGELPKFPSVKIPAFKLKTGGTSSEKISPKKSSPIEKILTAEEVKELQEPFQLTIPRKLTDDEEEILKKQVSSPVKLSEKPRITEWSKKDLEKLLELEQKKRKIMLGWLYIRSLAQVFEKNYPAGAKAFKGGNYAEARELFIKALAFPVYQNNPKLHRAVVLVMLRSYINDVIGKIAVVNQYLAVQGSLTETNSIFQAYQALFPILELQEWDQVLGAITELKKRIESFESRLQNNQMNYPPALGQMDEELRSALQTEAAPKLDGAITFKTLIIDLDLKEKVIRQNTSEELLKIQKQYEQALKMIQDKNWEQAREALQAIEFPSELANDAKKKMALIEKILAVQGTKQA